VFGRKTIFWWYEIREIDAKLTKRFPMPIQIFSSLGFRWVIQPSIGELRDPPDGSGLLTHPVLATCDPIWIPFFMVLPNHPSHTKLTRFQSPFFLCEEAVPLVRICLGKSLFPVRHWGQRPFPGKPCVFERKRRPKAENPSRVDSRIFG